MSEFIDRIDDISYAIDDATKETDNGSMSKDLLNVSNELVDCAFHVHIDKKVDRSRQSKINGAIWKLQQILKQSGMEDVHIN